jgi:hypothetical protein
MAYMPEPPTVIAASAAHKRSQAYVDSASLFTGS